MIKQHSIQKSLNHWIALTAAIFMLLGGLLSSHITFVEVAEEQDEIMLGIGGLMGNVLLSDSHNITISEEENGEIETETILLVQILNRKSDQDILQLPDRMDNGFYSITQDNKEWRVLVVTQDSSNNQIAIAQLTEARNYLAWLSGLNVFLPMLALVIFMLMMINRIIKYQFKQVNILAQQLQSQDVLQLKPLSKENIPDEIQPFVISLNHLLRKIKQSIDQHQRFIADAAHELRTPITAFSLLVENLDKSISKSEQKKRQKQLHTSVIRLRSLVNQLLSLARLQGGKQSQKDRVSCKKIIQQVIGDLHPLAETEKVDLGVVQFEDIYTIDQDFQLEQLIYNAINNAIQHSDKSGVVNVRLYQKNNDMIFSVEDAGVGIPEDELQNVMQPFYRLNNNKNLGNGLGLAICHEVAQTLGGTITLKNRHEGGLCFTYTCKCL